MNRKLNIKEEEAFLFLRTYLMRIDIEDPLVEPDFARNIVEKARLLAGSSALADDDRAKYARVADIFSKFC